MTYHFLLDFMECNYYIRPGNGPRYNSYIIIIIDKHFGVITAVNIAAIITASYMNWDKEKKDSEGYETDQVLYHYDALLYICVAPFNLTHHHPFSLLSLIIGGLGSHEVASFKLEYYACI